MAGFPPGMGAAVDHWIVLLLSAVVIVFYRLGNGQLMEDMRRIWGRHAA